VKKIAYPYVGMRMEAIEIVLVGKGSNASGTRNQPFIRK
jgi:hypothetical protein